jgi:hypothetical protein
VTVIVGGPPAGATTIRRVEVLRGTSPGALRPALPFAGKEAKGPKGWANVAGRCGLSDWHAARLDDRVVHVYELAGAHHVVTFDGRGQVVEDVAGGPCDPETARVLANAEWHRLREDATAEPWRWQVRR